MPSIALYISIHAVFLKHDWPYGTVKMTHLPPLLTASVSLVCKSLVLEQSLAAYPAKCSALVAYKILELFQY